jgi:ABC-type transporter Mla subunit MlaD
MSLPTLASDLDAADKQTADLLAQSTANTRQVQTALQPVRSAINAIQDAQTSQLSTIAEQSNKARPPLGAAIESAQAARDSQFRSLAEQGNLSAGLPASSPQAK